MQGISSHNYKKDRNIKELEFPYSFAFEKNSAHYQFPIETYILQYILSCRWKYFM